MPAAPRAARALALPMLAVALTACATRFAPTPQELPADMPRPMRPGDSLRLPDGGSVGYLRLRADSRCPPGATCVHAGWVELDFVHRAATGTPVDLMLSTRPGAPPARAGRWALELVEVGRGASPVAHLRASRAAE